MDLGTGSVSLPQGEIVREQEEQQQQEHQIESEENTSVDRPRLGEIRFWEMDKLQAVASAAMASSSSSLFAFPRFADVVELLVESAGAGANVARKHLLSEALAKVPLRFSPNSRITMESRAILRPVLVALQLRNDAGNDGCVLALSLAEAESLRWALEKAPSRFSYSLYIISESPMFDNDVVRNKASKSFHCLFALFLLSLQLTSSKGCFSTRHPTPATWATCEGTLFQP